MNYTRSQLEKEIAEITRDLQVFWDARESIRLRVIEVRDMESAGVHLRLTPLPDWSGTDAVLGSLDLSINAMERTLEQLEVLLTQTPPEKPFLTIVKKEDEDVH